MPSPLLKSLISTISIVINGSLFATLASSSFKFAADNIMLLHYFAFNITSNTFAILGKPYCSLHGYGQEISNIGSMLALVLITYRFSTFSKLSSLIWTMLICAPVLFLAFLTLQDEGDTFVFSDQAGECVKGSDNNRTMWSILMSFKIFLATLTLLLAFPASWSVYSTSNTVVERKRHAMLHLLTAIIFDSLLSGSHTVAQLVVDGTQYQKVSHTLLYTVASIRIIFVPLLLLSLHSGIRMVFLHMLGYGSVSQRMQNSMRQTTMSNPPSRNLTQEFPTSYSNQFSAYKEASTNSLNSNGSNPDCPSQPLPLHNTNSVEMLRNSNQFPRSRAISNSKGIASSKAGFPLQSDGSAMSIVIMPESLRSAQNPQISALTSDYKTHKAHRSTEF